MQTEHKTAENFNILADIILNHPNLSWSYMFSDLDIKNTMIIFELKFENAKNTAGYSTNDLCLISSKFRKTKMTKVHFNKKHTIISFLSVINEYL